MPMSFPSPSATTLRPMPSTSVGTTSPSARGSVTCAPPTKNRMARRSPGVSAGSPPTCLPPIWVWLWGVGRPGGSGRALLVLGLEPVAHAWFGDEVARVRRVGFQLAPDLGDEHAQVVRLVPVLRPPHLMQELPLADQPAGVPNQELHQLPLGRGQPDLPPVPYDLLGGQVDAEVRGLHDRDQLVGWGSPADGGAQAGQQLVEPERLGDVVIGARIEGGDLVGFALADAQHDDRDPGPTPQALDHLEAVDAGEAQVEDDHVGLLVGGCFEGFLAGGGEVDLITAGAQVDGQGAADLGLVVDYQHATHGAASWLGWPSAMGRLIRMVRPPPGVSPGVIWPCMASRNPWATASPSPTPLPLASPRRWKGWKRRSRSPGGMPGPWSMTWSSARSPWRAAVTWTGRSGGGQARALATTLATARSSRPGSAWIRGSVSGTSTWTPRPWSARLASAAGTTSSMPIGWLCRLSAPACSRLMSSRLPTRASSRSVCWSIVASSSAVASGGSATSSWSSPVTAVLIDASGVRRSWETAANSAVRSWLASASRVASAAALLSRRLSKATASWSVNALSTRRSSPARRRPVSASVVWGSSSTASVAYSGRIGAVWPATASMRQPCRSRRSRVTESSPKVTRSCSTSSGRGSWPCSSVPPRRASASASARARVASAVRRAARSTRALTTPATAMKTTKANRSACLAIWNR